MNLVGNAVKYSPTGNQVEITATNKDDQILIRIEDNGIGISKEDLPFIFEDFYTGTTDRNTERGSGVGLALTKRILEAHNGSVSVESELGKGSIFTLCLPAIKDNPIELTVMSKETVNNI